MAQLPATGQQEQPDGHWLEDLLDRQWIRVSLEVILGALLVFRIGHFLAGVAGRGWGYDFAAYWLAGRNLLTGEPLYTAAQLSGGYLPQEPFAYLYPPLLATLVAPIAALFADFRAAMWVWAAGGAGLTVVATWTVARAAGIRQPRAVLLLIAATFALAPVIFELIMGNVHLLLLGLLGTAWLALRRGSVQGELLAGIAIAVASLVKVFPAVLLLWLLLTGRWRAAFAAIGAGAAIVVATLPVTGHEAWLLYPRVLANLGPPSELWSSLAPISLLAEWLDFGLARVLVVSVGLGVLIWSARRQPTPISFAVAVSVSLLIVPTLYPHYLSLMVLPLLLAAAYVRPPLLPVVAWLILLVGGQLALTDLTDPVVRAAALLAATAPLACLLLARDSRIAAGAAAERLARDTPT
jgi:hypothetical protein